MKTHKNYTHPSSTLRVAIGERNPPTKPNAVDQNGAKEFCNDPGANLAEAEKTMSNPGEFHCTDDTGTHRSQFQGAVQVPREESHTAQKKKKLNDKTPIHEGV